MIIKRYDEYIIETRINTIRIQLDRFEGLMHKIIRCNTDSSYNVWYSDDIDVCNKITRMYTGKHALDLGGYSPSENDVFLQLGDYCLIIKTNLDDIVPREVIVDASHILISLVDKEDDAIIDMCKCSQVSSGQMSLNSGRIVFRSGNIIFEL